MSLVRNLMAAISIFHECEFGFQNERSSEETSENISKWPEWYKEKLKPNWDQDSGNRNQWSLDKKQLNAVCHGQYYQKDWPVLTIKGSSHDYSDEEIKH